MLSGVGTWLPEEGVDSSEGAESAFFSLGVGSGLPRVVREDRRVPTIGCVVCGGWRGGWGVSRTRKGVAAAQRGVPRVLGDSHIFGGGPVDWTCMD